MILPVSNEAVADSSGMKRVTCELVRGPFRAPVTVHTSVGTEDA